MLQKNILQKQLNQQIATSKNVPKQVITEIPFLLEKPGFIKNDNYLKNGHWTKKQKLKYILFIEFHQEKFINKEQRRLFKIFKAMSDFIKTRNPNQCRSHHQKMERQYENFMDIIETYWESYRLNKNQRVNNIYMTQMIGQDKLIKIHQENMERQNNYSVNIQQLYKQFSSMDQINMLKKSNNKQQKYSVLPPTDSTIKNNQLSYQDQSQLQNQQSIKQDQYELSNYKKQSNSKDQQYEQQVKLQYEAKKFNQNSYNNFITKKQQLVIQCHQNWIRWLQTALQLQQMVKIEEKLLNPNLNYH